MIRKTPENKQMKSVLSLFWFRAILFFHAIKIMARIPISYKAAYSAALIASFEKSLYITEQKDYYKCRKKN